MMIKIVRYKILLDRDLIDNIILCIGLNVKLDLAIGTFSFEK